MKVQFQLTKYLIKSFWENYETRSQFNESAHANTNKKSLT